MEITITPADVKSIESKTFQTERTRKIDRFEAPMQVRLALLGSIDGENRTTEVVWSTGAAVKRFDWMREEAYIEELSLAEGHVRMGRLNSGAPLLNTHGRYEVEDVIGVVEKAWLADGEGRATVRFSRREDVEPIFQDVKDGIIRNISVGYIVHRYEDVSTPEDIQNRTRRLRATDWEPTEISVVPVGADAKAGFRSDDERHACEVISYVEEVPEASEEERSTQDDTPTAGQAAPPAQAGGVGSLDLLRRRLELAVRI